MHRNVVQPKMNSYWKNQPLTSLLSKVLYVNANVGVKLTPPHGKPRVKSKNGVFTIETVIFRDGIDIGIIREPH